MSKPYHTEAVRLLKKMIAIPSFSEEEELLANLVFLYLQQQTDTVFRKKNNIWAKNKKFKPGLPTLLLNSHIDTVKPNSGYTCNPFEPIEKNGKLFGLGSNDAGGCVVSLLQVFLHYCHAEGLKYNIIIAITSEEENSGKYGLESIIPELGKIDFAIVGEPTQMHLAIAEKGLMVLDCLAQGKSGHAARNEGKNAIYVAMEDIARLKKYTFKKKSEMLGAVKVSTTMIQAGTQHNVIPDRCNFTIDVRTTEKYTNQEILEIIQKNIASKVKPRSIRLNPSSIDKNHPVVKAGIKYGRNIFGSPTTSDQALIMSPSLKLGPGDSARSHTANEYIYLSEIKEGIDLYIKILDEILL